jgi:hypothetical protein
MFYADGYVWAWCDDPPTLLKIDISNDAITGPVVTPSPAGTGWRYPAPMFVYKNKVYYSHTGGTGNTSRFFHTDLDGYSNITFIGAAEPTATGMNGFPKYESGRFLPDGTYLCRPHGNKPAVINPEMDTVEYWSSGTLSSTNTGLYNWPVILAKNGRVYMIRDYAATNIMTVDYVNKTTATISASAAVLFPALAASGFIFVDGGLLNPDTNQVSAVSVPANARGNTRILASNYRVYAFGSDNSVYVYEVASDGTVTYRTFASGLNLNGSTGCYAPNGKIYTANTAGNHTEIGVIDTHAKVRPSDAVLPQDMSKLAGSPYNLFFNR